MGGAAGPIFVFSQYYVQNIEVATTYEYGSTEYVHTSVYMSRMEHGATVQFIGADAMFRPQPGSHVVKDYDPTTDNLYLDSYVRKLINSYLILLSQSNL